MTNVPDYSKPFDESFLDFVKNHKDVVLTQEKFQELLQKLDELEKKLEIATKALKSFIPDGLTDGGFGEMYEDVIRSSIKALKEMEGVR